MKELLRAVSKMKATDSPEDGNNQSNADATMVCLCH